MKTKTLIQCLADTAQAYRNCLTSTPATDSTHSWAARHRDTLFKLQDLLPSGAGIDLGTKIDVERSNADKIVLTTSFHHMNEGGYYDGWTEHTVKVLPAFTGIDLNISGPNRNDIKDYLYEVYERCLTQPVDLTWDGNGLTVRFAQGI